MEMEFDILSTSGSALVENKIGQWKASKTMKSLISKAFIVGPYLIR